jgi:hypothetical protein
MASAIGLSGWRSIATDKTCRAASVAWVVIFE